MKETNDRAKSKKEDPRAISNIRVRNALRKNINNKLEQLNKKKIGSKKIIPSDILELAFKLLEDQHFDLLLENTVCGADRRKIARKAYIKKHGSISEGQFLDLIQDQEVDINDYLPDSMKRAKNSRKITNLQTA